ncbi:RecQ family ATP-dependent DNA helicase, partial [bacterium]
VKSPAMTGEWEAKLGLVERGEETLESFTTAIERFVREVVGNVATSAPDVPRAPRSAPSTTRGTPGAASSPRREFGTSGTSSNDASAVSASGSSRPPPPASAAPFTLSPPRVVRASLDLDTLLHDAFGFDAFRPYQEEVCRAAAAGQDVLLVMPTGAGKSLCYQLPGLSRGGTTLVISPLVALMEDQVAQLVRRGFAAERIHAGRPRLASREVCKAYLAGTLDFLFIAPERLKVPGFPEMLARRRPTLIAIDEAHCISQWGHDFRPDYRMLGERLPLLRPTPVIALTATATPTVQEDILRELRLDAPARFIHGFRRTNIAVEVVERSPGERASAVQSL